MSAANAAEADSLPAAPDRKSRAGKEVHAPWSLSGAGDPLLVKEVGAGQSGTDSPFLGEPRLRLAQSGVPGDRIATDNAWVLALLVPVVAVMHYGVILREERHLEERFGEDYVRYKASVRRWL